MSVSETVFSNTRLRVGAGIVLVCLLLLVIAGIPLGALLFLFVCIGAFMFGGGLWQVFAKQEAYFVTGQFHIRYDNIIALTEAEAENGEKVYRVSQGDGEPIYLSATEGKRLAAKLKQLKR